MLEDIIEVISSQRAVILVVLAVILLGALLWWWQRRGSAARRGLERALKAVSVEMLDDILIPDGMGGQIHLDRLLLTAQGLLVVDVKDFAGTVFAGERMDEWTVMGEERRFTFPNPQRPLLDRVAAVRQLARDLPVAGHVLFSERASFSKGRPETVLQPAELLERYRKPAKRDLARLLDAFYPHWERVRRETVSARTEC